MFDPSRSGIGDRTRVDRAEIDGIRLEYEDSGVGEPVVCIHGAFIADAFRPLLSESSLADRYRLISYHRRGYVRSSPTGQSVGLVGEASDCRKLLSHLGVRRAHVVGHSFGGAIGLQLALDAPQLVHTLSLLEAALMVGESAPLYRQALADSMHRYRETGARVAVDEFLQKRWPGYQEHLEHVLPGAFEQAVADAATSFAVDVPVTLDSRFGDAEARQITQPVLVVLGEKSAALHPRFAETHRLLLGWLPSAEGFILPHATHFLQMENPHAMAEALTDFYARHALSDSAAG
jgi:pimeloyl-ACP methyl ester carboxylesterase